MSGMDFLAGTPSTSLLVIKQGVIVYEENLHGYERDSRATSFSVAKSIVTTFVQIALQDGKIDRIDDPISTNVPRLAGSGFDDMRIVDILNISSRIDFS